jgi:hypothetical protein
MSLREAIKCLTEFAQQSGREPDIDTHRTILAAAQLQAMRDCVTSCEKKPEEEIVKLQCDHTYCRSCINRLFDNVLKDYNMLPHEMLPAHHRCAGQALRGWPCSCAPTSDWH